MENGKETEVVEIQSQSDILKNVEGNTAVEKIKAISDAVDGATRFALMKTRPGDWIKQGEKYYLQETGIGRVRGVFGIYVKDVSISKESFDDGSYAYICSGTAGSSLLNQLYGTTEIWIEGSRNANDPFFTGKDGKKSFDPMDLRKSAHTNFLVRATSALLGLKGYTQEDIAKLGINLGKIQKIEYKTGAEGGGNSEEISDGQRKRLFAIGKSVEINEGVLKEYLEKTYKISSTTKILRKDYDAIIEWVQKREWEKSINMGAEDQI